ncbi:hypothetical protein ACTXT7_016137, partial [Hymenolepis weldensis]
MAKAAANNKQTQFPDRKAESRMNKNVLICNNQLLNELERGRKNDSKTETENKAKKEK